MLSGGGVAHAAEPPNQNDPCSKAGRNTCGTNGEGSYRNYRYGIRWFGDYRGVVDDVTGGTFCIDLRFWYPSKAFDYEKRSAAGLKNKDGDAVSATNLRRMNRALWRYGRSNNAAQQAAVMVYVHRLMGDGAPGEADPKALSSASQSIYAKVVSDAERYAGPYKVKATLPDKLVAGKAAELTVEVLTSSGRRVPERRRQPRRDRRRRAAGLGRARARAAWPRRRSPAPTRRTASSSTPRAASLPDVLPALYAPTKGQSARNAQRIVQAAVVKPTREAAGAGAGAAGARRRRSPSRSRAAGSRDHRHGQGRPGSAARRRRSRPRSTARTPRATRSRAPTRRSGPGTIQATGDGDYVTAPVKLDTPGYYTYRESIAESDTIAAVETACAEAAETTIVRGTPTITTQVSAQETAPGAQITDSAVVTGLGKLAATVNVELWGPFPTREAITCEGTPFWTGHVPGGRRRHVHDRAGHADARPATTPTASRSPPPRPTTRWSTNCGEASETTLAKAAPQVTTVVSDAVVRPDAQLSDTLNVTGLGKTPATVEVELYGPYASRADIDCAGAPYWKGTVDAATGDGTYTSPEGHRPARRLLRLPREDRRRRRRSPPHQAECQVEAETSLAAPAILGGRGDNVAYVAQGGGGPSKVKLARLGIDAPVSAIGIDMKSGALGIPENIKRVGWWRDGATPGDEAGTALIAGHVDSAKAGAGAFYALKSARRGDTVTVTQGSKTLRYRVTTVKTMRKAALPTSIYTRDRLAEARPRDLRRAVRHQDRPLPGQHRGDRRPRLAMLLEHRGKTPQVDPSAYVAPNAIVCGDVRHRPGRAGPVRRGADRRGRLDRRSASAA